MWFRFDLLLRIHTFDSLSILYSQSFFSADCDFNIRRSSSRMSKATMNRSESRKQAATLRQRQIRSKTYAPQSNGPTPRFVADVMLGRLAKWLRIAGFDVLYSNRYSDDELVAVSQREGRILLSRDTRLLVRRAVKQFIFLENEDIQSQISQVLGSHESQACLEY